VRRLALTVLRQRALHPLLIQQPGEKAALILSDRLAELRTLDRYEQRALSRRNRATVVFDTVCETEKADGQTALPAKGPERSLTDRPDFKDRVMPAICGYVSI
jgi:hypothetical protein